MRILKITATFLLTFLAGIFIIDFIGEKVGSETNIEFFFYFLLILLPVLTSFVAGIQYPKKPLKLGLICGLILAFAFILILIWLSSIFRVPYFLIIIAGITVVISAMAAFLGAVFHRAHALWLRDKKPQETDPGE